MKSETRMMDSIGFLVFAIIVGMVLFGSLAFAQTPQNCTLFVSSHRSAGVEMMQAGEHSQAYLEYDAIIRSCLDQAISGDFFNRGANLEEMLRGEAHPELGRVDQALTDLRRAQQNPPERLILTALTSRIARLEALRDRLVREATSTSPARPRVQVASFYQRTFVNRVGPPVMTATGIVLGLSSFLFAALAGEAASVVNATNRGEVPWTGSASEAQSRADLMEPLAVGFGIAGALALGAGILWYATRGPGTSMIEERNPATNTPRLSFTGTGFRLSF